MLFNSINFAIFFPIVFVIYWILHKKFKSQNTLLLIASYIFYGWWDWRFLSLIVISSFIDYLVGNRIYNEKNEEYRKYWLYVSLTANLGLLGFFKYFNFFADSFTSMVSQFGWSPNDVTLNIILPVGISFYTFQTLSYTIDIYRKSFKPTTDIFAFFTYIAFFPQLVAGPIERASNLLPQIEKERKFNIKWFNAGIIQIAIGFFRKIVIADSIGAYVDVIYKNPDIYNSTTLIIATLFYAFQIYYDFAGYSDIAIGTAKLLGFKFNQNFNLPYFSKSITEFWRRWHMSLSFWLRDYLYISLGGNRKGIRITYRNLMITMLLGGLWHGSSWNFVIWGAIHGIALSIEKYAMSIGIGDFFKKYRLSFLGYFYTFVIVLFSWVFFRSSDIESALVVIKGILNLNFGMPFIGDINVFTTISFFVTLGVLFDLYLYNTEVDLEQLGEDMAMPKIVFSTSVIIVIIILFFSSSNNFIYFQF